MLFRSFYFEAPRIIGNVLNNTKYKKAYTLSIKIFDKNKIDFDSFGVAHEIGDNILFNRHLIQMISATTPYPFIDKFIRILSIEPREITDNTSNLTLRWNSIYNYNVIPSTTLEEMEVSADLKP